MFSDSKKFDDLIKSAEKMADELFDNQPHQPVSSSNSRSNRWTKVRRAEKELAGAVSRGRRAREALNNPRATPPERAPSSPRAASVPPQSVPALENMFRRVLGDINDRSGKNQEILQQLLVPDNQKRPFSPPSTPVFGNTFRIAMEDINDGLEKNLGKNQRIPHQPLAPVTQKPPVVPFIQSPSPKRPVTSGKSNPSPGSHNHKDLSYTEISNAGEKAYKLFKDRGHYSKDLARLIERACQNVNTGGMSKYQAQGFSTLRKSMRPGISSSNSSRSPSSFPGGSSFISSSGFELGKDWSSDDEAVILKFFKQYDQLFFFGTLSARCTCKIEWPSSPNITGQCDSSVQYGYNTQVGGASQHIRCHIMLRKMQGSSQQARLNKYLGTLLHEMCHAFLSI